MSSRLLKQDRTPKVRAADPDGLGRLVDVPVSLDGDYAVAVLPEFGIWQLITIDL